jgi:hypothetical protein
LPSTHMCHDHSDVSSLLLKLDERSRVPVNVLQTLTKVGHAVATT